MTFVGCFRWKPKKRKARIITAPPEVIHGRTEEEDCGEESISSVPEPVVPELVTPERPTADKGKGIAIGDDESRTVNISDSDHEVINWSEVSYDSDTDRSGPSSYYPRPSRRARSPPTRLLPCQETAETASDDCHPPPPSSPSPNYLADDYYQPHSYYPTENYYPQPIYKLPVACLYPENEPPAYYQTYPPCHHQVQEPEPQMSDTEKLAHRITKAIFGPVNPYHPGCSHPMHF